jgi:hypothetical protein
VIVEKLFPLGYLEYFEGEDGGKGRTEGPRCEAEEMGLDEAWKVRIFLASLVLILKC